MMRVLLVLMVMVASSGCAEVRVVRQQLVQGGFWIAQVAPGSEVLVDGKNVAVSKDGLVGIGFARDAGEQIWVKVCEPERVCELRRLDVASRVYKLQQVRGVPGETVNPNSVQEKRIALDNKAIKAAREKQSELTAFAKAFRSPVPNGVETGVYGSRRMYNGEERSWHRGYDLAAKVGTPVFAPADGIVRLVRDTFMTGNLVLLDHGFGFNTVYAHLDRTKVRSGEKVKAGDKLGTVGKTGRATGPHLHWGFFWHQVPLDPKLLLAP